MAWEDVRGKLFSLPAVLEILSWHSSPQGVTNLIILGKGCLQGTMHVATPLGWPWGGWRRGWEWAFMGLGGEGSLSQVSGVCDGWWSAQAWSFLKEHCDSPLSHPPTWTPSAIKVIYWLLLALCFVFSLFKTWVEKRPSLRSWQICCEKAVVGLISLSLTSVAWTWQYL